MSTCDIFVSQAPLSQYSRACPPMPPRSHPSQDVKILTNRSGGDKVISIAAGASHTLFVMAKGELRGCGRNDMGQLGGEGIDDVPPGGMDVLEPVRLMGHRTELCGRRVLAAHASEHSLIVLDNGKVLGFGANVHGQLGLGHRKDTRRPIELPIDGREAQIYMGAFHTFVLYPGMRRRARSLPPPPRAPRPQSQICSFVDLCVIPDLLLC